jgi:protein-tyrosine phosphatase
VPAPYATVLCVCTANVCRSPAAELLLRSGLRRRLGPDGVATGKPAPPAVAAALWPGDGPPGDGAEPPVRVSSAGIWASSGRPVEPATAAALRAHGVTAADLADIRSTPLRREAVASADLILAASAEHVRGVWRLQLAARPRTFTLGELVRLAAAVPEGLLPPDDPAARLRALVSAAEAIRDARRAPGGPYVTEAYDLADPADNDLAQRDMVEQTAAAVDALLDLVAGRPLVPARLPWPRRAVQWSRSRARRGAAP